MRSPLRKRLIVLTVQAALATAAIPALAESPAADGSVELGQIEVTGQTPLPVAPTSVKPVGPVQVVTQQQLKETGLASVGDILARLTVFGSGINSTANFGANGESCINLRNLGCNRVLVLVNGKRWPSLITGEVDMNTIPLAIVDHIEILKSGASADYGSGAVAGVVNIVTRSNFNGNEASAYFGEYQDGGQRDGQTQSYEFTHGITTANSSSVFNVSYVDQRPILEGARAITSYPNIGTGVTRGSDVTPQGHYIFINPNTGQTENLTITPGVPGNTPANYQPFNPTTDFFNFAPANYLLTPSKRVGLYGQGTYDFNDNLSAHYTALYNDRRSDQQGGPAEINIGAQGSTPIGVSASNPYNPFGFNLNATGANPNLLLLAYQPIETGLRYWHEDSQTFYLGAGVDGNFTVAAHTFSWSVNAMVNRNTMTSTDGPEINLNNLALALGPASNCGPGTPNPGCVPLNVFGGQFNGGGITPAMWNYVSYTASSYIQTDERDYIANISTPLVQLPAGPLKATLGYEYLNDSGQFTPDALQALGESSLNIGFGAHPNPPISGGYHMNAGSLAFNVPILANAPFAKSLVLDAATRDSNYDTFGGINSNLAALHWTVDDRLALRASWSQDFNAPNIAQLFSASVFGQIPVKDPCSNYPSVGGAVATNCAAAGVPAGYTQVAQLVPTTAGRNPSLQPETSTSRTVGGTWQPVESIPLMLSADYFKIEVDNNIGSINPQDVLNGCYISGISNYCGFISRNASGAINNLQTGNVNLGTLLTEGVDFDAKYTLLTQAIGTFGFDWLTTWVKLFNQTTPNFSDPSQPIVASLINTETGRPAAGYPRFKSLFTTTWTYDSWQVQWQMQYFNNLLESCSDRYDGTPLSFTNLGLCSYSNFANNGLSTNKIGAATFNNVQAKYNFADNQTTLTFGINNVFNKEPPIAHSIGSYDTTMYPIPGRFPYVSLSHQF
ncbi:MAG TPA: TonB-dependent receptor [Gammaproteobacteria bacterium]|nr:TonB-dependent receptor [Gammaproteobacteria bacterium]